MSSKEEVIIFLEGVKTYLYGDLTNFDRLCMEAEEREEGRNNSDITNILTTTDLTTYSPNSVDNSEETTLFPRSTVPHALALFATIDLIGSLIRDPNIKLKSKNPSNKDNMTLFFGSLLNKNEIECLCFIYRNGLAHSFFPKKRWGSMLIPQILKISKIIYSFQKMIL